MCVCVCVCLFKNEYFYSIMNVPTLLASDITNFYLSIYLSIYLSMFVY